MSQGILKRLEITPGIQRNLTEYQARNTWVSCDHIRFRQGQLEKIGGWTLDNTSNNYLGTARAIHAWSDIDLTKHLAVGTEKGLFLRRGGQWYDITPVVVSGQTASVFTGVSGTTDVIVSIAGTGMDVGDSIVFTPGQTIDGITVSGRYDATSVGTGWFQIQVSSTITDNFVQQGTSVNYQVLLPNGSSFRTFQDGWGRNGWSSGGWGEPVSGAEGVEVLGRQWSLDNWGDDLFAVPRGGALYRWAHVSGPTSRAFQVTTAPNAINSFLISTPTRHVVLFGTSLQGTDFDPMGVRWSSNESFTVWDAATTNAAGDQILQKGSYIVGGVQTKLETLVFTDKSVHSMRQVDAPIFFRFDRLGDNCGAISPHSFVDVNGVVYWMGLKSFWRYDGQVEELNSTLDKAIFETDRPNSINFEQSDLIYAGVNSEYSEVIWLYPSKNSTDIDRYVIYNYLERLWYDGTLSRTTWLGPTVTFNKPFATGTSAGTLYKHETGVNDNTNILQAFAKTGELEIEDGDTLMFVDQVVPDLRVAGEAQITLYAKKYPNSNVVVKGPYIIQGTTDFISTRLRGRSVALEVNSSVFSGDFELGAVRIRAQPDGER